MDAPMKAYEQHERRDWVVILILLLLGLLFILIAGEWALRFSPSWELPASMGSNLDPNSDFLTRRSGGFLQPVDPAILTLPVWIDVFLTPGASFITRTPPPPPPTITVTSPPVVRTPTPTQAASPTNAFFVFASPTNTLVYYSPTAPPRPTRTPMNVTSSADLQITKDNGVLVYSAGDILTYTVVVTNNGPDNVTSAVVSDAILPQITSWSWTCTSQNNGANGCDEASNSNVDFNDTVNLPNGGSIVYTVTANTSGSASGNLSNTAFITIPAGYIDPVPGNNSATDTDDLLNTLPYGEIGTEPNGIVSVVPPGGSLTIALPAPYLVVGNNPGWDLILYELPNNYGIAMDLIILQIGDGNNWYTIFNWGDNLPDTNSNLDISVIGGLETDNRNFTTPPNSDLLYPFNSGTPSNPATGIVIELDGVVPNGTYYYIRIISPVSGDMDGGCEIDAIVILP
jgi:uncharacterized repeat protein (TIGR01451 family)